MACSNFQIHKYFTTQTADLITFTEEILNGKLHFLCSEKSKTVIRIHQRSLQTLATEIYKAKNKISPEIVNSLFEFTYQKIRS